MKVLRRFILPFLTHRVECTLQNMAEAGYVLVSLQKELFWYKLSFAYSSSQNQRYYVFKIADTGKASIRFPDVRENALSEVLPYCAEVFECDGFSFIGKIGPAVPDIVLQRIVSKRMMHTLKHHLKCLALWCLLPLAFRIAVALSKTPWTWGNITAVFVIMGVICTYHLVAALISYAEVSVVNR